MKKQIIGQMNVFDILIPDKRPHFKRYPNATIGTCPICGTRVFYDATYGRNPNPWIAREPICDGCGARFEDVIPKDLPCLSGLNDRPIVLRIGCTGYTDADIERHGGVEWLRYRRCTEWFSSEDTEAIDRYIEEAKV